MKGKIEMAGRTEFDGGRFKELVLLLAERSKDDPRMSRVKLNKLLYLVDFDAYRLLGHSLTGATYIKGEHGPMAAQLPLAEKELGERGYLGWRSEGEPPYTQKIPVALETADESRFTADELRIIEAALAQLADVGGGGARDWSHEESVGWNEVEDEEAIPYHSAVFSTEPIPDSDVERARELALSRGWAERRP
jgi:hypothetical protein